MELSTASIRTLCKEHNLYSAALYLNEVLYLQSKGISRLQGFEEFTGVRTLYLENNVIEEIQGLEPMPQLRCLYLGNNVIYQIANLDAHVHLHTLDLSNNRLCNLRGLPVLPQLRTLNVSGNQLRVAGDLEPVATLPELVALDISGNKLEGSGMMGVLQALQVAWLRVVGNPVVAATSYYRKLLITSIQQLNYLDDHPVRPNDRRLAAAFMEGGFPREKHERGVIQQEERDARERHRQRFDAMVQQARERAAANPTPLPDPMRFRAVPIGESDDEDALDEFGRSRTLATAEQSRDATHAPPNQPPPHVRDKENLSDNVQTPPAASPPRHVPGEPQERSLRVARSSPEADRRPPEVAAAAAPLRSPELFLEVAAHRSSVPSQDSPMQVSDADALRSISTQGGVAGDLHPHQALRRQDPEALEARSESGPARLTVNVAPPVQTKELRCEEVRSPAQSPTCSVQSGASSGTLSLDDLYVHVDASPPNPVSLARAAAAAGVARHAVGEDPAPRGLRNVKMTSRIQQALERSARQPVWGTALYQRLWAAAVAVGEGREHRDGDPQQPERAKSPPLQSGPQNIGEGVEEQDGSCMDSTSSTGQLTDSPRGHRPATHSGSSTFISPQLQGHADVSVSSTVTSSYREAPQETSVAGGSSSSSAAQAGPSHSQSLSQPQQDSASRHGHAAFGGMWGSGGRAQMRTAFASQPGHADQQSPQDHGNSLQVGSASGKAAASGHVQQSPLTVFANVAPGPSLRVRTTGAASSSGSRDAMRAMLEQSSSPGVFDSWHHGAGPSRLGRDTGKRVADGADVQLAHTRALSDTGAMRSIGHTWSVLAVEVEREGSGAVAQGRVPREDSANELRRRRFGSTGQDVDSPRWFQINRTCTLPIDVGGGVSPTGSPVRRRDSASDVASLLLQARDSVINQPESPSQLQRFPPGIFDAPGTAEAAEFSQGPLASERSALLLGPDSANTTAAQDAVACLFLHPADEPGPSTRPQAPPPLQLPPRASNSQARRPTNVGDLDSADWGELQLSTRDDSAHNVVKRERHRTMADSPLGMQRFGRDGSLQADATPRAVAGEQPGPFAPDDSALGRDAPGPSLQAAQLMYRHSLSGRQVADFE